MNLNELDRYRREKGFLTSQDIKAIRSRYGINKKNFSIIMGINYDTVYMFESFKLQTKYIDNLMRKIGEDPLYFLELLELNKSKIYPYYYDLYKERACKYMKGRKKYYIKSLILAEYKSIYRSKNLVGKTSLNLRKINDIINYILKFFPGIPGFQLENMLMHIDFLSNNVNGNSITGLAYKMHKRFAKIYCGNLIFELLDLTKTRIYCFSLWEDYKFWPRENYRIKYLTRGDLHIIDTIVAYFKVSHIVEILSRLEYIDEEHSFRIRYGRDGELVNYGLSYLLDVKKKREIESYFFT